MSFMATTSSHSSASWQWQPRGHRGERGGHGGHSKLPSLHLVVGVDDLNVGLGRLLRAEFTSVDSVPVLANWCRLLARLATVEDPVAKKLEEEGLKKQISPSPDAVFCRSKPKSIRCGIRKKLLDVLGPRPPTPRPRTTVRPSSPCVSHPNPSLRIEKPCITSPVRL